MKYKNIVFDIDGTLIDKYNFGENKFFPGIEDMLEQLYVEGFSIGIISSCRRGEYEENFKDKFFYKYIKETILYEDTKCHKPNPEPMFEYIKRTGAKTEEILFIGDSIYDLECAEKAGVDSGLALWGTRDEKHLRAKYYFEKPNDLFEFLRKEKLSSEDKMINWAIELQFIGQTGMAYTENMYNLERFGRIREIASEMLAEKSKISYEKIEELFLGEEGYQTPKMDTRAVIFKDDKILLIQEKDEGKWALPGGWLDVLESIQSNTIKEAKEESGLDVIPKKIIAIHNSKYHNASSMAYRVERVFVLCELIGGEFVENQETIQSGYFGLDELPKLSERKNTIKQIEMCFDANKDNNWKTKFD